MTENEILRLLDNSNDGYYSCFVELGNPNSYLIDSRVNVFRGDNEQWTIAIERLGYNPREAAIRLDIYYYGNCLVNLETYNNRKSNYYSINLIKPESLFDTFEDEYLKSDAKYWNVRGQQIPLSRNLLDYIESNIHLQEYDSDMIGVEEVARLVVSQNPDIFRATDEELYKSIPQELKKILQIDQWFHKDFQLESSPSMDEVQIKQIYEFNKNLTGIAGLSFENFAQAFRNQDMLKNDESREMWDNNRPSSYETWQLIAKVIVENNTNFYNPKIKANSHWSNWPESGTL